MLVNYINKEISCIHKTNSIFQPEKFLTTDHGSCWRGPVSWLSQNVCPAKNLWTTIFYSCRIAAMVLGYCPIQQVAVLGPDESCAALDLCE